MERRDRQAALDRFESALELPLLILALAMIPLIVLPLVMDLSEPVENALIAADWFIWAVFAFEYVVRLSLTTERGRFVRREWPDLLIVVLPFLRPLRIARSARALRALRLVRLAAALGEINQEARRLIVRHRLHYTLLLTGLIVVGAAAAVLLAEEHSGGSIDSFGDALWWAITTVTTVGYGDTYPITAAGRGVAAFLMLAGIAFFGVLTANVAAFFLERVPETTTPGPDALSEIRERLAVIEQLLREQSQGSP